MRAVRSDSHRVHAELHQQISQVERVEQVGIDDDLFARALDAEGAGVARPVALIGVQHRDHLDHDPARPVGVMFEHAFRNKQIYQAVGTEHLHPMIFEALRAHLCTHETRLPVEVLAQYHASALIGLLGWWVRAGFPYGPAEMARMCREMTAGLAAPH